MWPSSIAPVQVTNRHVPWHLGHWHKAGRYYVKIQETQAKQPVNEPQMWCPGNISKNTHTYRWMKESGLAIPQPPRARQCGQGLYAPRSKRGLTESAHQVTWAHLMDLNPNRRIVGRRRRLCFSNFYICFPLHMKELQSFYFVPLYSIREVQNKTIPHVGKCQFPKNPGALYTVEQEPNQRKLSLSTS